MRGGAGGTAAERAPELRADARPHALAVSCHLNSCACEYAGQAIFDSDTLGFPLRFTAKAGESHAVSVELPAGQSGAQVRATFCQVGAAAACAAFAVVARG